MSLGTGTAQPAAGGSVRLEQPVRSGRALRPGRLGSAHPPGGRARGGRSRGDGGSAVVEFVTLGLLLLLPLVYLVLTIGRVQAASFAADGSAREAARAFVTSDSDAEGERRAIDAVRLGLSDQGFDAADGALDFDCSAARCLTPGERVVAQVEVRVVLPGIPAFADAVVPLHVTVRASHVAVVDAFRPTEGGG